MKVYLVAGVNPSIPSASGIRSYVLSLAPRLHARGADVQILGAGQAVHVSYGRFSGVTPEFPTSNYRFIRGLWRWARSHSLESDAIVHGQRPDDLYPILHRFPRARLVCTLHGDPARGVRQRRLVGRYAYALVERKTLKAAKRVISVSESGLIRYLNRFPWLASKSVVVPIGVDLNLFRPQDRTASRSTLGFRDRFTLLFAGRLEPEKRVGTIIEALRGLRDPPDLVIAGQGRLETHLRSLARGLPVRFLGPVPRERMPTLLSAANAVVLPSSFEGLPTIALESLACGTPVIATPVGDLPHLLTNGVTGLFFDGSAVGFRSVLHDKNALLEPMAPACVAVANAYAWDKIVDRILEVYRAAA